MFWRKTKEKTKTYTIKVENTYSMHTYMFHFLTKKERDSHYNYILKKWEYFLTKGIDVPIKIEEGDLEGFVPRNTDWAINVNNITLKASVIESVQLGIWYVERVKE